MTSQAALFLQVPGHHHINSLHTDACKEPCTTAVLQQVASRCPPGLPQPQQKFLRWKELH